MGVYSVEYEVKGFITVEVDAESYDEAVDVANTEINEYDFGEVYNIDYRMNEVTVEE